ncbi:MAG: tetratricopeptide repeat protein [Flavobacteriales bacterium]|nr:tetratricopeptide repeat protein [Flavobacteriales bacterium]
MAKKKAKSKAKKSAVNQPWWQQSRMVYLVLCIAGLILYANTLGNDYALDDAIAITSNQFTKQGVAGIPDLFKYDTFTGFFGTAKELVAGGRYRPLSLVTFAIEYELFGESPSAGHFFNILFYVLTAIVIWQLVQRMIASKWPQDSDSANKWYLSLPLVVALLFLAHPLHTEVVANIKGRDDMLAFLGAMLAWKYSWDYLDGKGFKYALFSALALFAGLLSKENAITFLAVIPLGHYFFTEKSISKIAMNFVPLLLGAAAFLAIRFAVIGFPKTEIATELMNNPFLQMSVTQKYATIIYTLGVYLKLLFFPHPLTYDYYPYHIPITNLTDLRFITSAVLYVAMGVFALTRLPRRDVMSFGILYFFATMSIVSNLFFPIGAFMNERFAYFGSFAWTLLIGVLLIRRLPRVMEALRAEKVAQYVIAVLLIGFTIKTVTRNPDWKNDFTLFQHDVHISKNSAKSNVTAGGSLIDAADAVQQPQQQKQMYHEAIEYLDRALEIHPNYVDALLLRGNAEFKLNQNIEGTLEYYFDILELAPDNVNVPRNMLIVLNSSKSAKYQVEVIDRYLTYKPNNYEMLIRKGELYGKSMKMFGKAEEAFKAATDVHPDDVRGWKNLGTVYGIRERYQDAINALKKAEQIAPNDREVLMNLAITYNRMGDSEMARQYQRRVPN